MSIDKREHVSDFIEGCADHSAAQLATALINWISDTDELIDMASRYLGYEEPEDTEDEDSEDEEEDAEVEYSDADDAGRTCGMCGDELGNGQCIAWIDEDRFSWSVHEDCYRSGRYLTLEAYCASEARKVAMNDSVSSLDMQAVYPDETDATGVLYRG